MPYRSLFPVLGYWQDVHRGFDLLPFVNDAAPKVKQAFAVMTFVHAAQRRKGPSARAYAAHPLMVYLLVREVTRDEDLLCAALLHDVVEDMDKSFPGVSRKNVLANIKTVFGDRVAELVSNLSNPDGLDWTTKQAWQFEHFKQHPEIQLVKLADKIANAYDSLADTPPWAKDKLAQGVTDAERFAAVADRVPPIYKTFVQYLRREATRKGWL